MAGRKKQSELTAEEKLQQALVPEAEQPYKVPDNWCWVHLLDTFVNCTDSKKKIKQKDYLNEGSFPIIDQGKSLIGGFTKNNELVFNDKLPVIIFGDHTRCIKYIDFSFVQGADGVKVLKSQSFYNEKLFYYALQNLNIEDLGYRRHFPTFNKYVMPLPPLAEQQRIVERIENLFAKLDEAKEKLQNTLDTFETRKAAILHKAFTGELTANWRKQHGLTMDSWEEKTLGEVAILGSGGTPSRKVPESYLGNVPWVKTGEVLWNYIYDTEEKISDEAINNSSAKYFPKGTVLVAMYGQGLTRGRAAILAVEATTNQAVCALQPKQILKSEYLFYYFMTNYWEYREKAIGGNQPNYSATMISKWLINLPTPDEQIEIVCIIDNLLAKEQQAHSIAQNALAQIDLIKKSILARAFRGQLATNNPADEPAIELLKKVL